MKSVAALIVCSLVAPAALADLADDVRCREIGFSKSVEAQNREWFASFIDPDARFITNAVARGTEAISESWSGFFAEDGPPIKWRPQFVEVLENGKLALTRGPYRMIIKDDQDIETERWGTFNSVWHLNTDGEWLVVFDAGSDPDESPTDEVKALLDREDDCGA